MALLTLRSTRDSALTWEEGDANLLALDSDSPWKVSANHITYDGKVGISVDSTYTPVYDLDFGNGDSATVGITNGDLVVHVDGPNELKVWNNTVQSITVKTTGKVGINDSDPSEMLTVGGNLRVSDTALANVMSANSITDGNLSISGGDVNNIQRLTVLNDSVEVQFGNLYSKTSGIRILDWDSSLTTSQFKVPTSRAVNRSFNALISDIDSDAAATGLQEITDVGNLTTNNIDVGADPSVTGLRLYASGSIYARLESASSSQLFRGYGGNNLTSWIDGNGSAHFSGDILVGNAAAVYGQFGNDMVLGTTDCTAVMPITNGQADVGGATNQFKDGFFTGTVSAGKLASKFWARSTWGLALGTSSVIPTDASGVNNGGAIDIGNTGAKFKDAHFSSNVFASALVNTGGGGILPGGSTGSPTLLPTNNAGTLTNGVMNIGNGTNKWNSAFFTGTVSSTAVNAVRIYRTAAGACGLEFQTSNEVRPTNNSGALTNGTMSIGNASYKFKDAHFGGRTQTKNLTVGDGTATFAEIETLFSDGAGPKLQFNHYYGSPDEAYISAVKRGGGAGVSLGHGAGTRWKDAFFTGQVACGAVLSTGDVTAFHTSDERLKENIKPLENALDKVSQINGVEFDWKELSDKERETIHGEGHDVGVIAQQVERVLPEIVAERDNGYKAVKYDRLTALLIEAVKELSAKVKELESK